MNLPGITVKPDSERAAGGSGAYGAETAGEDRGRDGPGEESADGGGQGDVRVGDEALREDDGRARSNDERTV